MIPAMTGQDLARLVAEPGANAFVYHDAAFPDRPLTLYSARPFRYDANTPVLFVHHGVGRNGADYRDYWLPMIDEGKSYKSMMTELGEVLPKTHDCVASQSLGEPQRALLDYYLGLITQRIENGAGDNCKYFLEQGKKIWEGARPGDNSERFRLYQR